MVDRSREILEQLLRERTPEERERLSQAWERVAGGDPDSLPALFALSDRFSLEAHAALLGEARGIHASFEAMARQIGEGASATVTRTEAAAQANRDCAARLEALIPKLEAIAVRQAGASGVSLVLPPPATTAATKSAPTAKAPNGSHHGQTVAFLVIAAAGTGGGFWLGSVSEREDASKLLHEWSAGDKNAQAVASERIRSYRELHGFTGKPAR